MTRFKTLLKARSLPGVVINQSAQPARHILLYRPVTLDVCPALHLDDVTSLRDCSLRARYHGRASREKPAKSLCESCKLLSIRL